MIQRKNQIYRYSEFSVNRQIAKDLVIDDFLQSLNDCEIYYDNTKKTPIRYYYLEQKWESKYFGITSIFLKFIDFDEKATFLTKESISKFLKELELKYSSFIITIEIPSEENKIIQVLNKSDFKLIETRLHYYNNDLEKFSGPRASVRVANNSDINNLKNVALEMRNDFDRFHSDDIFDTDVADRYLATYIENSVNGFVDLVLVPNEINIPPDSFLTANYLRNKWTKLDHNISKMILSAVSSKTNKGWYIKLISEMTFRLRESGADTIFMNTQSTNIAVLYTWEKLGYHIGRTTHLLSKHVI